MISQRLWLTAACVAAFTAGAQAQDYPNKPVTLITPAAAGNSPDVVTRLVADRLTRLVEAAGHRAQPPGRRRTDRRCRRRPPCRQDGYSLYMTQASTFTVLPITHKNKIPVDLDKAFIPVGIVGEQPLAVAVNKDVPANSVAELIALVNKTPGGMLFAATNRGGQSHLTGELLRERGKVNMSFVHSASGAASINDVIAGRIPIMFEGLAGTRGQHRKR